MSDNIVLNIAVTPVSRHRPVDFTVSVNNTPFDIGVLPQNKSSTIEIPLGPEYSQVQIDLEMHNKDASDNVLDNSGRIVVDHGLVISMISVIWPLTERDQHLLDWMSQMSGSEDTTNRADAERDRQQEIKRNVVMNSSFHKFIPNESMLRAACSTNTDLPLELIPNRFGQVGRLFRLSRNGKFSINFSKPFAYWALKNFI
jgi:hypothetical protein